MARNLYYVSPSGTIWTVQATDGYLYSMNATKEDAISVAQALAYANQPSQIMLKLQNGEWHAEWTYGDEQQSAQTARAPHPQKKPPAP